jgi:hypothetical protein
VQEVDPIQVPRIESRQGKEDDRPRAPDDREGLWLCVASDRGCPRCDWRRSLTHCHRGLAHLHGSTLLVHAWVPSPSGATPQRVSALGRACIARVCGCSDTAARPQTASVLGRDQPRPRYCCCCSCVSLGKELTGSVCIHLIGNCSS